MREQIGKTKCLCCGEEIPVKKSAGGAVSVSCPWCDFSGYARASTQAYRFIEKRIIAPAVPEAASETKPKPAAKPAAPVAQKPAAKQPAGLPWER